MGPTHRRPARRRNCAHRSTAHTRGETTRGPPLGGDPIHARRSAPARSAARSGSTVASIAPHACVGDVIVASQFESAGIPCRVGGPSHDRIDGFGAPLVTGLLISPVLGPPSGPG